jgi:hypothetical protein
VCWCGGSRRCVLHSTSWHWLRAVANRLAGVPCWCYCVDCSGCIRAAIPISTTVCSCSQHRRTGKVPHAVQADPSPRVGFIPCSCKPSNRANNPNQHLQSHQHVCGSRPHLVRDGVNTRACGCPLVQPLDHRMRTRAPRRLEPTAIGKATDHGHHSKECRTDSVTHHVVVIRLQWCDT